MRRRPPELAQVAALGLIQGAAELLPVSSSAHVAAIPQVLGWEVASWDGARRKELEVALHAGAALALAPSFWRLRPDMRTLALSLAPPVVVGYFLERPIEERLGGPLGLAAGLLGGAAAMLVADRVGWLEFLREGQGWATQRGLAWSPLSLGAWLGRCGGGETEARGSEARGSEARGPEARGPEARGPEARGSEARGSEARGPEARGTAALGVALGFAQAAALVPGVSRSGATLAAARALGYSREEASRLSFGVAGPVLVGATALKAWRGRRTADPKLLATGIAASFVGTRAALSVFGLERGPLWPFAVERALLAGVILGVRYGRRP